MIICVCSGRKLERYAIEAFPHHIKIEEQGEIIVDKKGDQLLLSCNQYLRCKSHYKSISKHQLIHLEYLLFYLEVTLCFITDYQSYISYQKIIPKAHFIIGTSAQCDIQIIKITKGIKLSITKNNSGWHVKDLSQHNYLYHEGCTLGSISLLRGKIHYLHLVIYFYDNFIMLNLIKESKLEPFQITEYDQEKRVCRSEEAHAIYHTNRSEKRTEVLLEDYKKVLDNQSSDTLNYVPQRIMALGAISVAVLNIVFQYSAGSDWFRYLPSLIFPTTMIFSVLFWPKIHSRLKSKALQLKLTNRNEEYFSYLNVLFNRLLLINQTQRINQAQRYPNRLLFSNIVVENKLFCHCRGHSDFLCIGLGYGDIKSNLLIKVKNVDVYQSHDDVLRNKQYEIQRSLSTINDGIVELNLNLFHFTSFIIQNNLLMTTLKNVAAQCFLLHHYNDVRGCFLVNKSDVESILCFYNLEHIYSMNNSRRFIVTTSNQIASLNDYLLEVLEDCWLLLFVKETVLLESIPKEIVMHKKTRILQFVSYEEKLHTSSEVKVDLRKFNHIVYFEKQEDHTFRSMLNQEDLSSFLAQISFKKQTNYFHHTFGLLCCYNAINLQQLHLEKRWNDNSGLMAVLGVNQQNQRVMLDLSENKDGPHGLIVGSTGSGKSELVLTLILSLAINYSPLDVQFVIVDYKGGSCVHSLTQDNKILPHLVATITNHDENELFRSLYYLKQECYRRQKILIKAAKTSKLTIKNLKEYRKARVHFKELQPLANLILIIDEFAELKKEQPEFLRECISIARIGRSLGVHLILSTQKPSGVIDDQILSNINFRMCLKVQDEQDSIEVIRSNKAAQINESGYFYLISNKKKEYVKAAYVQHYYQEKPFRLEIVDSTLNPSYIYKENSNKHKTELQVLVPCLQKKSLSLGIATNTLWPSLPHSENLCSIKKDKNSMVLGVYDDIKNNTHHVLSYNGINENCLCLSTQNKNSYSFLHIISENININNHRAYLITSNLNWCAKLIPIYDDVIELHDVRKLNRLLKLIDEVYSNCIIVIDDLMGFLEVVEYSPKVMSLLRNNTKKSLSFTALVQSLAGFRFSILNYFNILISLDKMSLSEQYTFFNQSYLYDNQLALFYKNQFYEFALALPSIIKSQKKERNTLWKNASNISDYELIIGQDSDTNEAIVLSNNREVLIFAKYQDSFDLIVDYLVKLKDSRCILDESSQQLNNMKSSTERAQFIKENKACYVTTYASFIQSDFRNCFNLDRVVWIGNGLCHQSIIPCSISLEDDEGVISENGRIRKFRCIKP